MREFVTADKWGDQGFIRSILNDIQQQQDIYPDQIFSYKNHIAAEGMLGFDLKLSKGDGLVPKTARIICFHGNPRRWKTNLTWVPKFNLYDKAVSKYHKIFCGKNN